MVLKLLTYLYVKFLSQQQVVWSEIPVIDQHKVTSKGFTHTHTFI